ncbi:MAG: hypothetical protein ACYC0C_14945 [Devosia sp.]
MKTFAKLGLAAALVIGSSAFAMAEEAGMKAGIKAGIKAGASTSVDATTTGSVNNYGSLISNLQAGGTADLSTWTDTSTVNFVTVSSLQGQAGANAQALDNALTKNQEMMTSLQASIEANAALKAKIEAGGYAVDDIIAVETSADGAIIFYVDDRA